jgi:hypothetical protein
MGVGRADTIRAVLCDGFEEAALPIGTAATVHSLIAWTLPRRLDLVHFRALSRLPPVIDQAGGEPSPEMPWYFIPPSRYFCSATAANAVRDGAGGGNGSSDKRSRSHVARESTSACPHPTDNRVLLNPATPEVL